MRKRVYFGVLFGVIGLIALALAFGRTESESGNELIITPKRGEFRVTVTATGELQAKNSILIYGPQTARSSRISQMTITRLVPEGTVVEKGDFVAELDRSEINTRIKDEQLDLQRAQSLYTQTKLDTTLTLSRARDNLINLQYAMEESKLKMEESVYEAPSVRRQAEINYEKAERAYEQAVKNYQTQVEQSIAQMSEVEADLQQVKDRLELYMQTMREFTVYAPGDGMVIYAKEWNGRKITENTQIRAWDPVVATLPDLSVMESLVYISEVDIQKISRGQHVNIGLDADPGKKLTGQVTDIANVGEQRPNSDSKVFEIRIVVNEADTTLRPAMTTSNEIVVDEVDNALFLPLECIHTEDSLTFVYRKEDGGSVKQEVRLGLFNENEAVIQEGITDQHRIYISTPENAEDLKVVRLPEPEQPV
ncbi:MAG TPA: efflux RND transporter periplasmic adaptor subunit [bacterium]|nr:efflux RND transporter periplasmic adaptor subunit [bacterium]